MKRICILAVLSILSILLISSCTEQSMLKDEQGSGFGPELASVDTPDSETYYLAAVDWDGVTPPKPGVFYRTDDINALKSFYVADEDIVNLLNSLPSKQKVVESESPTDAVDQNEPDLLKVTVTTVSTKESTGPMLAALGWSGTASITPINGGATARCSTYTTNPAGVTGFKSHQIWVYNQYGKVYFGDVWETEDLLEHAVYLTHDRSVACDSTVKCGARVVLEGATMAWHSVTYVRSCD